MRMTITFKTEQDLEHFVDARTVTHLERLDEKTILFDYDHHLKHVAEATYNAKVTAEVDAEVIDYFYN